MAASVATFHDLDISSSSSGAPPSGSGGASSAVGAGAFSGTTSSAFEPAVTASGVAAASPDLAVTVSEPMKQGEGMSAYFTYEVSTKTSLPQYAHNKPAQRKKPSLLRKCVPRCLRHDRSSVALTVPAAQSAARGLGLTQRDLRNLRSAFNEVRRPSGGCGAR